VIRILLADDHLLFRQAVRDVIAMEQDLEVVAEAENGQRAVLLAAETQPDVVLLALTMPTYESFEATERILACAPQTRVVIMAASHREEHVLRALQCGAIGYITKDVGPEGLLTALRRAAHNELYITSPLATHFLAFIRTLTPGATQTEQRTHMLDQSNPLIHPSKQRKSKRAIPLSQREQEVLALIRQGQRNREIATQLRISEATVHKHVQHIFEKLNAHNRTEALFLAQS
jgi:two-component system, NarL family, nitrate/nitrite response regulator NarL